MTRIAIIGGGPAGYEAALVAVQLGAQVTLVDRHGPANALSSSPGQTRIWRLAHPDRVRVRLAQRGVAAMSRLAERSGATVFLRRGLLWRDDVTVDEVAGALVAEGVETAEQAAFLRQEGCELAQGYYFGRPVPPEIFTDGFNPPAAAPCRTGD